MSYWENFVSSLIENRLIDELNFFVNPVAIGKGLQVFSRQTPLGSIASVAYPSGIVVNTYRPGVTLSRSITTNKGASRCHAI